MKKILMSAVALTALTSSATLLNAAEGLNILEDVKLKGEIRPRYEMADVNDNGLDSANAFTTRLHLSATAGLLDVDGLSTTLGIQSVNNFGYTDYAPATTGYDTILDPQTAMLSEASIDYKVAKTVLHAGCRG